MRVITIGFGSANLAIVKSLYEKKHAVSIIEKNTQKISPEFIENFPELNILHGDATDIDFLRKNNITGYDLGLSLTSSDKINLIFSQLAKFEFAVNKVFSLVNDSNNRWLFNSRWGVDYCLPVPEIASSLIEENVVIGKFIEPFNLYDKQTKFLSIILEENSELAGKSLKKLELPENCILSAIIREEKLVIPSPDTILNGLDRLIFICENKSIAKLNLIFQI